MPNLVLDNLEVIERTSESRIEADERQVEELKQAHAIALEANNEAHLRRLDQLLQKIEPLERRLRSAHVENSTLADDIENALSPSPPYYFGHGVALPNGRILVVRYAGKYGAIKALDQASESRGGYIRYADRVRQRARLAKMASFDRARQPEPDTGAIRAVE